MSSATTMTADDDGFTKVPQRRQRNPTENSAAPNGGEAKRRENGNGADRPKRQPRSAQPAKATATTTNADGAEKKQQDAPNQQGGRQWNKRGERRPASGTPRERRPRSVPAEGAEAAATGDAKTGSENVPSRRGGERKQRRPAERRGPKEPRVDSRVTVFVSGINIQDLTNVSPASLAKHYVQKRVECLFGVLGLFGPITASEVHVSDHTNDSKNYILVAYDSHDHAARAIRSLKDRHYVRDLVARIGKDVLTAQNLPISLAPDARWFIDWSDKEIAAPRTSTVPSEAAEKQPKKERQAEPAPKKAAPKPKAAAAPAPAPAPAAAPVEAATKPAKSEKKQKKQKAAESTAAADSSTTTTATATATATESPVVEETPSVAQPPAPVQPPAPQPTPSELRREAEKANLNSELQYLIQQQERVLTEIASERERCKTRDQRIAYLAEQLQRVQLEMQHIQRQLSSEESFKKSAEERRQKLEEELQHMKDEQVRVEAHLESIENTPPASIRWVDAE